MRPAAALRIGLEVRCSVCGAAVGLLKQSSGPTCGSLLCLAKVAIDARDEIKRQQRRAEQDATTQWFQSVRGSTVDDSSDVLGVVPFFDRILVESDPARTAEFLANLTAAAAAAVAEGERGENAGSDPLDPAEGSHPELNAACATCRGYCCHQGGTHAFLNEEEVAWKRRRSAPGSVQDFIDLYAAHLPARSYEKSCVFHGETGCALPRSARARICNSFRCYGLRDLADDVDRRRPHHVHVAAVGDGRLCATVSIARDADLPGTADPAGQASA